VQVQPPEPPGAGDRADALAPSDRSRTADEASRTPADSGAPRTPPTDIVDFSAEAGRLLRAREAAAGEAGEDAATRTELVERLRAELEAGGYRVDAGAVARALAAAEDEL
jgi:anti-sigma28 factor (negative regulator of flagellin synthesis)